MEKTILSSIKIDNIKIINEIVRNDSNIRVFVGLDEQDRLVLIKLLEKNKITNLDYEAEFIQETNALTVLNSNVVSKILKHGANNDFIYIVTEYINGVPLSNLISYEILSEKTLLNIILQVAEAMAYVHKHGVIHSDLSPKNIIITNDGCVKIIDFGLSHFINSIQNNIASGGTPSYIAPEVLNNPSSISPASDIFALGIIIYEVFIGKESHGNVDLSDIPIGIRSIIKKAIEKNPKDRFEDMDAFVKELYKYKGSDTLSKFITDSNIKRNNVSNIASFSRAISNIPVFSKIKNFKIAFSKKLYGIENVCSVYQVLNDEIVLLVSEPSDQHDPIMASAIFGAIGISINFENDLSNLISSINDFVIKFFAGRVLKLIAIKIINDEFKILCFGYENLFFKKYSLNALKLKTEKTSIGKYALNESEYISDKIESGDVLIFCNHTGQIDISKIDDMLNTQDIKVDVIAQEISSIIALEQSAPPEIVTLVILCL